MARIRKRGAKWQAQVRRSGIRGISRTFHLRKDAVAWARQMELHVDKLGLPLDTKILKRITLAELVERYRDTISIRKRGYEVERIVLTAFLRHAICRRHLSDLTTEDFAAYRDERLTTVKATTLKRELSPLHNLFEIAREEWGLPIHENPLSKLRLTIPQQRRERRLKDGELEMLTLSAERCRNQSVLPIILFALETGMRRSEILSLKWIGVDWERRSLLLTQTKNGRCRTIPLSTRALAVLKLVSQTDQRVFPMTGNAFRLAWERVRARAGISDLHFHDLRHEAISRFFELGLSMPEVALISGHRDLRMLFRYTHPVRETILKKLS
jgi:integrase